MKKIIYPILFIAIFLFLFPSLLYRVLPTKKVQLNTEIKVYKGQTVRFDNNKYMTHCGFNIVEGRRASPMVSWKINGKDFPCGDTISFQIYHGPKNIPFGFDVTSSWRQNPSIGKIIPSNVQFNDWSYGYLQSNCDTAYNDSHPEEKPDCYKESIPDLGSPEVCRTQKILSTTDCLNNYIEKFRSKCIPRGEINSEYGTAPAIPNQDDCLYEQIIFRHLPSENCSLLIKDKTKAQSCLEERRVEEEYLESLRQ